MTARTRARCRVDSGLHSGTRIGGFVCFRVRMESCKEPVLLADNRKLRQQFLGKVQPYLTKVIGGSALQDYQATPDETQIFS